MQAQPSELTDVDLLRAVARRDESALAAVYDRYRLILFGLILRILHDRQEAEDREFADFRDAAALLAHASTPTELRPEVRGRILDAVRNEKQPRTTVAPFRAVPANRAWPDLLRLAAAIAFIALMIAVVVLWRRDAQSRQEIVRLSQQLDRQQKELATNSEAMARQLEVIELISSQGVKRIELAGTATAPTARATFVYGQASGRATSLAKGLPAPPSGMAYEVWFIPKGEAPIPGKTFTVDAAGQAVIADQIPPAARENITIAVTLEPKGGSPAPTGAVYLSGPPT